MKHILRCHDIRKTDFVRGENCYLFDQRGERYVDFESGIWCTVLGHCHPRISRVMREQIERVIHLGTRYPHMLADGYLVGCYPGGRLLRFDPALTMPTSEINRLLERLDRALHGAGGG